MTKKDENVPTMPAFYPARLAAEFAAGLIFAADPGEIPEATTAQLNYWSRNCPGGPMSQEDQKVAAQLAKDNGWNRTVALMYWDFWALGKVWQARIGHIVRLREAAEKEKK